MDIQIIKVIHLVSVMLVFYATGALMYGARNSPIKQFPGRRFHLALHGLGLVALILSGFSLMGALSIGLPHWLKAKFVIWLALSIGLSMGLRKREWIPWLWILFLTLGAIATYLALAKPEF